MIVISNTSPIINLAVVGRLGLLRQLYGKVTIPRAVYDEIVLSGAGQPGAVEAQTADWIEMKVVSDLARAASLQLELDAGEAEAIALALELGPDLLLLDERKGRAVAAHFGIRCLGLLGILVEAKHRGLVPAVKPILDRLIQGAGFWISQALYDHVLQAVGE